MKYVKELQNRKIGHGNRLFRISNIQHMAKIGEAYFCADKNNSMRYDFGIFTKKMYTNV